MQDARQIGDVLHEIIVLGAGPRDPDGVAFLERVIADEMGRDLSGDADDGNGVAQRIGEPGDRVGRARPRGHEHAADLAGRARIALGGVDRTLLVAHENVADVFLMEQRIIDRQHGPAGIAEYVFDALILQGFDDHLGAGHFFCHCLAPSVAVAYPRIKKGPESPLVQRTIKTGRQDGPQTVRPRTTTLATKLHIWPGSIAKVAPL